MNSCGKLATVGRVFCALMLLPLITACFPGTFPAAAIAEGGLTASQFELKTIPSVEGWTSKPKVINLREALGTEAMNLFDVWMLSTDKCAFLSNSGQSVGLELLLFDIQAGAIMARAAIPEAESLVREGWLGGYRYWLFQHEDSPDVSAPCTLVQLTPEGTLRTTMVAGDLMLMPGKQTAIHESTDASLYAIDQGTGVRRLLLQGVPEGYAEGGINATYDMFLRYEPADDEPVYNGKDENGESLEFITMPVNEEVFHDNALFFWRTYQAMESLDAQRFLYTVHGWEWGAGFGVYDLETATNHRVTGLGYFYGMFGGKLFGSHLVADANTYEASALPATIQEQLAAVSAMEYGFVDYDFSQDGKLLALTGMKSRDMNAKTASISDVATGKTLLSLDIIEPAFTSISVSFDDGNGLAILGIDAQNAPYLVLLGTQDRDAIH